MKIFFAVASIDESGADSLPSAQMPVALFEKIVFISISFTSELPSVIFAPYSALMPDTVFDVDVNVDAV